MTLSQSEWHPASCPSWKRRAKEEGFGGEKHLKVSWGCRAASLLPVMPVAVPGSRTTGDLSQPGEPPRHKPRWEADNGGAEVQRGAGPGEQIPALGSRRGFPHQPVPLLALFYPEAEMSGQAALALLLLLGELC